MAKKKMTTTHGNPTKDQEQQLGVPMAMDDASLEKLQSLKTLNNILLKQTVELREQVDTLKQSNGSLEADLTRSKSEMDVLRSELTQLNERTVELEVERNVVVVFAGELGDVIKKEKDGFMRDKFAIEGKLEGLERKLLEVSAEKDENESVAKAKIGAQLSELNAMGKRLIEAEKREKVVCVNLEKLKAEYGSTMEEKEEMGRKIDEILRDKNLLEKSLTDYSKEIDEIKSEIERIGREKEEIKQERDVQLVKSSELETDVRELNVTVSNLQSEEEKLRLYVAELEDKCSEGAEQGKDMQRHLDQLVKENNEMELRLQSLINGKGLVDKDLDEALKTIDEYKQKMAEMADENVKIGVDNVKKVSEIEELEKQVVGLRNVVSEIEKHCSDQDEEIKKLRVYVAELEDKCSEGVEQGKDMQRHLDELVKEKNEMGLRLQSLIDGKGLVDKDLDEALKTIDEYKQKIAEMADENVKIGMDNAKKVSEIEELEKQVVGLRNVVSEIEKSCSDKEEEIKKLMSELDHYIDDFERIKVEKNEATKELDDEKQNGFSLKQRIAEMEKNIDVNLQLIKKIQAENSDITYDKEELGRHLSELKKEMATHVKECADANNELSDMRVKAELAESRSQLVLNALRSTAEFVSSKDEQIVSNGSYLDHELIKEEIEMYVVEMEAIKSAFRTKESKVNDLSKQLEFLENSMAVAHKKKSLLTMVSSVTSIFAAFSLAYLARGGR